MEQTATLLVCCPDRKGLVAALAQLLYGHGANILDADQHTDPVAGQFFQRIKFDLSELHTDRTSLETAISEVAARFSMDWRITNGHRRSKTAIFVSKYDHCLYDLLLRQRGRELSTEIPMIISNHPDLEPVAQQFGIPFHHLPITKETKRAQENKALELLREADVDLVVLARYMQILTDDFLKSYEGQVINIHHSFLPAFMGSKPYHRAFERGVKLIGATAHYATAELDDGPIIEQDVVRCSHSDSVEDLVRKGRDLEKVVLARAVRLHLDDRILVYDNKTVVFS
ncbi:MAG: formyltetrahydrofolate deformylase [Deltaproteobacteria bacterium]|nr:formyltetrahydrofolate deformylase [Deltaproteobacteria bacterium]MBW1904942.1 formyltetrahydrofolate deformylase [Deltaproteobacteria bacterium]MBW2585941.1 formyltetrahydrofolate deformylase [Deltaproteobacteria bacterium]